MTMMTVIVIIVTGYCYYSCYADCRLAQQQQCGSCPGSNPLWSAFQLLCIHLRAGGAGITLAASDGPQDQEEYSLFRGQ